MTTYLPGHPDLDGDRPSALEAIADSDLPHMEKERLAARLPSHSHRLDTLPPDTSYTTTAWCTICGRNETSPEVRDHAEALDALHTLGWTDLPTMGPACPTCGPAVHATRDALDQDDQLDGERRRSDNLAAAIDIEQRRHRRTA